MRKFDTKVQHLKYKVLREVARLAWNDTLAENIVTGSVDGYNAQWDINGENVTLGVKKI